MSGTRKQQKLSFQKDLKTLMYGFGDVRNPRPDTLRLMEDLLFEYITELCENAAKPLTMRGGGRLKTEDFLFALRHSPRHLARAQELIQKQKMIADARKVGVDDLKALAKLGDGAGAAGASGVGNVPRGSSSQAQAADGTPITTEMEPISNAPSPITIVSGGDIGVNIDGDMDLDVDAEAEKVDKEIVAPTTSLKVSTTKKFSGDDLLDQLMGV